MRRIILMVLMLVMAAPMAMAKPLTGSEGSRLDPQVISRLNSPWALAFINPKEMLITTKSGQMMLLTTDGQTRHVKGVPPVFEGGQGGLGDVTPHPDFAENQLIYFSFVASNDNGKNPICKGDARPIDHRS